MGLPGHPFLLSRPAPLTPVVLHLYCTSGTVGAVTSCHHLHLTGQIPLWAAHYCRASAQQQSPSAAGSALGPICSWVLRACGGAPPPSNRFLVKHRQGTSTSSWGLPADVPRRTPLPVSRSCPWAPRAPSACLPRGSGQPPSGEERSKDAAAPTPPRVAFTAVRSPRAGAELPSGNTHQVGKAELSHGSEGLPALPATAQPYELRSSSKSPDRSPSRLFLAASNGSWGEQEQGSHLRCCPEYC